LYQGMASAMPQSILEQEGFSPGVGRAIGAVAQRLKPTNFCGLRHED